MVNRRFSTEMVAGFMARTFVIETALFGSWSLAAINTDTAHFCHSEGFCHETSNVKHETSNILQT